MSDLNKQDGVWAFSISDAGEEQRVKTRTAIRKVPASQTLLDLGLVEYADALREQGQDRLFPDLLRGTRTWGQKVSKWFNETYKHQCGIADDPSGARKTFHSFRHTAITKALGTGIPLQHCQAVFGHEQSLLGETRTYVHEYPIAQLVRVVEALDWQLSHKRNSRGTSGKQSHRRRRMHPLTE